MDYDSPLQFPRLTLMKRPTPVRRLNIISNILNANIWMKFDDPSTAMGGGTKVRNLEYLLGKAKFDSAQSLIGYGNIHSNFVYTLARYANRFGIKTELYVARAGLTQASIEARVALLSSSGAVVHVTTTAHMAVCNYYAKTIGQHLRIHGTMEVPVGGASPVGCLGTLDAAYELYHQIRSGELPTPSMIFVPVGSGGLLAGLSAGFRSIDLSTKLVGVRVSGGPSRQTVQRLAARTAQMAQFGGPPTNGRRRPNLEIWDNFQRSGIGERLVKGISASSGDGIDLDPRYTPKAFLAMCDFVRHKRVSGPILFWNTNSVGAYAVDSSLR